MSGKLDKPLDEIVTAQRRSGRRPSTRRSTGGRPTTAAPIGGVQKHAAKPARGAATKPTPAKAAVVTGDSKVIVSNLPKDVSEKQIKEYFVQSVGPIKRVELSYGPNSQSRGIANVTFSKPDGASKALRSLNGLLVDGRPIKIEIVVGASQADKVIPPTKTLAERTSHPKAQPKSAAGKKPVAANAKPSAAKGPAPANGNKKRKGRNARPAKKTAEELDSEMADYFASNDGGAENAPAAAPAPAAATGDAAMEEDIM